MNIFVTDESTQKSAEALCDKHVVKMVVETGQILSTAILFHAPKTEGLYKPTHKNHPCVVWARSSREAFHWTLSHGMALAMEYQFRFLRRHKTHDLLNSMIRLSLLIPEKGVLAPHVYCGPEEYKTQDAKESYRIYLAAKYKIWGEKKARWTKCSPPDWFV